LADIFAVETRLRRLLGLTVNDVRILRPADEPTTAEFLPGWHIVLTRYVDLHKQKSNIKSLELRQKAAKTLTNGDELLKALDRACLTGQTNFNRRKAADERVKATESDFRNGQASVDLLLRSQVSLAAAEVAYYQSLVNYNKAIADIHFHNRTLLEMEIQAISRVSIELLRLWVF